MKKKNLKLAIYRAGKSLWNMFPILIGTILLVSLLSALIPKSFYINIFQKNTLIDSLIGSLIGGISAGNPITSYILGGELLKQGIGLIAVTAFIVSWVTVGIVQLPSEISVLGKKFSILRNLISFILSILVAIATVLIYNLI